MITVYSTPTCAYCPMVKRYLSYKGVPYLEKDALTAPEYAQLAQEHGTSVPLIVDGDKALVGYDIAKMNEIFNIK